jgi:hypothetical protein
MVVKAGADRQAQRWRGWDGHPYIRAFGNRCGHVWLHGLRKEGLDEQPSPKVRMKEGKSCNIAAAIRESAAI